jgi:hypothetical protein
MKINRLNFSWLLVVLLFVVGCGGDPTSDAFKEMNKLNMSKIVNSYVMFASVNNNVGPKNEEELINFIKTDERVAPRLGMSSSDFGSLDSLFTSDADGEPFVVRFGLKIRTDEDRSPLVFDKTGVDGMRRVALADNTIIEVTDAKKYARMLAGKASSKESGVNESEIDAAVE